MLIWACFPSDNTPGDKLTKPKSMALQKDFSSSLWKLWRKSLSKFSHVYHTTLQLSGDKRLLQDELRSWSFFLLVLHCCKQPLHLGELTATMQMSMWYAHSGQMSAIPQDPCSPKIWPAWLTLQQFSHNRQLFQLRNHLQGLSLLPHSLAAVQAHFWPKACCMLAFCPCSGTPCLALWTILIGSFILACLDCLPKNEHFCTVAQNKILSSYLNAVTSLTSRTIKALELKLWK